MYMIVAFRAHMDYTIYLYYLVNIPIVQEIYPSRSVYSVVEKKKSFLTYISLVVFKFTKYTLQVYGILYHASAELSNQLIIIVL